MSEQDEQVYWVPLTKAERATTDAALYVYGPTMPEDREVRLAARRKLESARPEHPKRWEALEDLARAADIHRKCSMDHTKRTSGQQLDLALDRLRSLEGE